jgi:hypothetical protein
MSPTGQSNILVQGQWIAIRDLDMNSQDPGKIYFFRTSADISLKLGRSQVAIPLRSFFWLNSEEEIENIIGIKPFKYDLSGKSILISLWGKANPKKLHMNEVSIGSSVPAATTFVVRLAEPAVLKDVDGIERSLGSVLFLDANENICGVM